MCEWLSFLFHDFECTVSKCRKFSLTLFCQKFRESNSFTREVTKELISRNIFSVRENFSCFHTVLQSSVLHCRKTRNSLSPKNVSWNQLFTIQQKGCFHEIVKSVTVNVFNFHTVSSIHFDANFIDWCENRLHTILKISRYQWAQLSTLRLCSKRPKNWKIGPIVLKLKSRPSFKVYLVNLLIGAAKNWAIL